MGNFVSRLNCIRQKEGSLSDKELRSVREVISALRENVEEIGHGWLFRPGPAMHHQIVSEMVLALEKSQPRHVERLLNDGFRIETAQALLIYLNKRGQPLVPEYIQSLALDAPDDIAPEVIATDVLGLMKQDVPEKRLELLILLLNLLNTVIKYSPSDELRGSTLPLSMLPLFFNIQNQHVQDWRKIVTIFVELIRKAATETEETITTRESSFSNESADSRYS
ncbi:uncharacterized protein LOC109602805 isoform X2 [Aethina tumida]|uniref:uncharacterized protein LOC109602805 isoform X2 n=1 Tax=Aethina tumida TaxID=116153 RepID=UPI00096B41A3|nr:uncharacterized protein LOC109602805 isoform X2 [Aethina tumida]